MQKRHFAYSAIGFAMLATTAIAQTAAPNAPATNAPAPAATPAPMADSNAKPENNLAGQGKWRASKLMGVDIYGPDNTKVGDVTEVLFSKDGKIEMVTVGVGGFLGIGAKDVAVPFEQIQWSDQPMQSASAGTNATGAGSMGTGSASNTGTAGTAGTTGTMSGANQTAAAAPRAPEMYPDHGKISMTKEQLSAAPAVSYAAR